MCLEGSQLANSCHMETIYTAEREEVERQDYEKAKKKRGKGKKKTVFLFQCFLQGIKKING